jgi:N6-adenosine-specific RNA methylase IME4
MTSLANHNGQFDIVYVDPPWPMYGDPNKNAAAGKHYSLMDMNEIESMDLVSLLRDRRHGAFFVWATCPRLDLTMDAIRSWGLHYRGVAFVWVKTRKDGAVIGAQGVPPTATKPTTELCLFATTQKRGRPFKLQSAGVGQVVLAPRGRHSEKPTEVRGRIVELYGDRPRIELFARGDIEPGWSTWGHEA